LSYDMRIFTRSIYLILIAIVMVSCSDFNEPKNKHQFEVNEVSASMAAYSRLAAANAQDAAIAAAAMNQSIVDFLFRPTDENRLAMESAWNNAHIAFVAIGTGTFEEAASDDPLTALIYRLDAWPIQPGYIDAIEYYPNSGIVNDITVELSRDSLRRQHGFSDAEEIVLGFHPLEYLIFANEAIDYQLVEHRIQSSRDAGQDNQVSQFSEEAGETSFESGSDSSPGANPVARRRTLLELLGADIAESLDQYITAYREGIPNSFSSSSGQQQALQLVNLLLSVAYKHADNGFEESNLMLVSDESHSRFSQTTHLNISLRLENLGKIINEPVWLSRSLKKLDMQIEQDLQTTLAQGNLIIEKNQFDEADRARLPTIFSALRHQLADLQLKLTNPYKPDQDPWQP